MLLLLFSDRPDVRQEMHALLFLSSEIVIGSVFDTGYCNPANFRPCLILAKRRPTAFQSQINFGQTILYVRAEKFQPHVILGLYCRGQKSQNKLRPKKDYSISMVKFILSAANWNKYLTCALLFS